MTITISVRKLHLAIAVLAVALIAPATAVATHIFDDVDDGRFYAGPIEWALDNDITTGSPAGSGTFKPDDPVTRGESVTFLNRYDDNIVQPGLDALEGPVGGNSAAIVANDADIATNTSGIATNTTGVATNTSGITALDTAMPFAVTSFGNTASGDLTATPTAYVTVTVTAPVDGHVTVNSTAHVSHGTDGADVLCQIVESTAPAIPLVISGVGESAQWHETGGSGENGSLSGTRTFAIAAGATVDYVLACQEFIDGGFINARNLTAIFTPAR